MSPRLEIEEHGVDTANDAAKPKERRKYQKRPHQHLGEASNLSTRGRRRAAGCPGTRRALGPLATSTLLSDGSNKCSDRVLPKPSIFFTPPETRSKCPARSCGNWTRNLFPNGQPTMGGSQSVVPQQLLKIALINMNWGGRSWKTHVALLLGESCILYKAWEVKTPN